MFAAGVPGPRSSFPTRCRGARSLRCPVPGVPRSPNNSLRGQPSLFNLRLEPVGPNKALLEKKGYSPVVDDYFRPLPVSRKHL